MPRGGNSKIENDLMEVENTRDAEFVKMHLPLAQSAPDPNSKL